MRINLRKALALMLSVLMLCTLIPMGAMSVSAATNLVSNGTFESGTSGWACSTGATMTATTTDPGSGSQSLALDASTVDYVWTYTSVTVTANTDYTISFKAKVANNGLNINFNNASWGSAGISQIQVGSPSTWTDYSYDFNSGDNTTLLVFFQSGWSMTAGGMIYLDDVVIAEKSTAAPEVPTDFGRIENGGFEEATGGMTIKYGSRTTEDAYSGSYSLKSNSNNKYGIYAYTTFECVANTDYTFSFYIKLAGDAADGVSPQPRLYVKDSTESTNLKQLNITDATTEWKKYSVTVNSGSNTTLYFNFAQGINNGGSCYIDDVIVEGPAPEDVVPTGENLIVNGSFEDGSNGWTMNTNGSVVSGGQDGSYSLQMQDPATAYANIAYQYVTVEPGKAYTLTWYAKRVSGTGIFNLYYDGATRTSGQNWMNETSGEWVRYEIELTVNATTTNLLIKFSNEAANTSGTVLIDNVVLTKNPEASFDGYITNGDFEIGTMQGWNCSQTATASTSAAYSGNYGAHITNPAGNYGGMIYQNTVNVVAGKTYTVSFWIKVTVGYVNFQIKDGSTSGTNLTTKGYNSNTWTQGSFTVTPTTNVLCINFCGGGTGTVDEAYVDDMLVVEEKDPSNDGYIYNGDFETGKNTPWTVHQSTAVSAEAKYEGNFGMKLSGVGTNWGGLLNQTISNLKVGQTYNLTLMMKILADGINLQVTSGSNKLAAKYYATNNAGDWTEVTLTFVADATTAVFNVCGSGNSGATVTVYMDNVKVSREGGEIYPEELISFGGSSIRENSDGTGLAFRFLIDATSGQKTSTNEYVENSGKITLDEVQYDLVRMGAVMTNKASVGTTDFTLANVNGTNVIDIKGQYLAGLESDSVAFAVRIIDIPTGKTGTEIYARPYYVYLEDGVEVTVYGDIKSNNYDKAANPKASIKILSIGSSFSKDVMVTYLYDMFKAGGYDEVVIGYLYMGGCSIVKHLYNAENSLAQYEYGKNSNGTWVQNYDVSSLEALHDEDWDYVTIHGSSDYIGGETISKITLGRDSEGAEVDIDDTTEYEALPKLVDWVKDNVLDASTKIEYHMIWAYSADCDLWSFAYHDYNQMTMYNKIINNTKTSVHWLNDIDGIIPSGTSIQNGRTSLIGDNFNETDGYHLNSKYGDYTAALTWYSFFSGEDATVMAGYTGDLSAEEFEAVAEAVNNALSKPYAITESTHK